MVAVTAPLGKLRVLDFSFHLSQPYTFWAGLVGGCVLTTASHGTEQLLVQRLLAARDERQSRAALFASWAVILFQFGLFLWIGLMLFVVHSDRHLAAPHPLDRLYPEFVWNSLPHGLAGLVIAAILAAAMSNLSAALNSLASTTVIDFWRPLDLPMPAWLGELGLARAATIVWGAVLLLIGGFARHWGGVLEAGLTIASIAYGGLLGVFLLGLMPRRVSQSAAILGMAAGISAELWLKLGTAIAWTWYAAIGTAVTFLTALLASAVTRGSSGRLEASGD